ncbi:MAG TPA: hypothetical protein VF310_02750, partial [Vicinamibacteria bacterium]
MRRRLLFALLLTAAPAATWAQSGAFCPPYPSSPLYRPRLRQVPANPGNWVARIEGALAGDEILLADGTYNLAQYAVQISVPLTVRGASGNRDAVVIRGAGYGTPSEGFMVHAVNVTIADLTMTQIRNHAISIKGESGAEAPHVYNVHLYDIGTQHIKGTPGDGVGDGVIACSRLGYTPGGARGDYLDAIDIHRGINWTVRDNEIYNHWGDGTGCEVDADCGLYASGGGPAILFWNNSSGTIVERNRLLDAYRGIALGFGSPHPGGAVRNNFFYQPTAGRAGARGFISADMGVQVDYGNGTLVDHNTVILGGSYQGAVEVWHSSSITVRNNLLSRPVWDRGGNTGLTVAGNKGNAVAADLAVAGDPHLAAGSTAIDFAGVVATPVTIDVDNQTRPQGARADAGCDEWIACTPPAAGARFFPLTPCRLVDTRDPVGPRGGPALGSGTVRPLALAGACGVPAAARALAVNVTVTGGTSDGFVHFAPGGCSLPLSSTVNFRAARARANSALLSLALDGSGSLGARAVLQDAGRVHL